MAKKQTISVILPTYNEKGFTIRKGVKDFETLGIIDEIIVISNNAMKAQPNKWPEPPPIKKYLQLEPGYGSSYSEEGYKATGDLILSANQMTPLWQMTFINSYHIDDTSM